MDKKIEPALFVIVFFTLISCGTTKTAQGSGDTKTDVGLGKNTDSLIISSPVALGWAGGWLMGQAQRHDWMVEAIAQLGLLSLALLTWLIADAVGGNGFIAAFVAGIVVSNRFEEAGTHAVEFSEAWGQILNFLVLFGFGIMAVSKLGVMNLTIIVFTILSLTVIRMVPVALSMIGRGST